MRRLLTAAGVDYDQWKALTLVALKLDFRQMSFGRAQTRTRDIKGVGVIVGQLIFYTMFGAFMAAAVWFVPDLFLAATLLMTMTLFLVGMTILLEHNSALTSPTDYPVLGYRPVSSRTYFAARLANVLVYTTTLTTAVAYLPIATLFLRYGVAVGIAGVLGVYACATSVALAVLLGYAAMLRVFGAGALKRALTYLQLLMSFVVYGGYFVFAQFFRESALRSFTLSKSFWVLLFPGTWFASYLELAAGRTGPTEWIPAAVSIAVLAAMATGLGGRLSLDYSERLGALASMAERRRPGAAGRRRRAFWFTRGEGRAMALLIRSQFTNDQRFRMAVLTILPLTLLYVALGVKDGAMNDPFDPDAADRGLSLVNVAILMFPSMLKLSVTHSDAFRASWIFFASPADRMQLIRAAKNVLVAFFLVPYLLFVAALFTYFVHNVVHVAIHLALLGLISHLCLQVLVLLEPDVPFSKPPMKGRSTTSTFLVLFVIFVVLGVFQSLSSRVYQSPILIAATFAGLIATSVVIDLATRARVDRLTRLAEFQG
jgi:hypothetical protein